MVVAYRALSAFTDEPVEAVLHGLRGDTQNPKTGAMAQLLICPVALPPHEAAELGLDDAVCGQCPLRPAAGDCCYSVLGRWFPRGLFTLASRHVADLDLAGRALRDSRLAVRLGSWGDPAALPVELSERLADAARAPNGRWQHTGYTRAWPQCDPRFARFAMASVFSPLEREQARALGYRTFRVRAADMPVLRGEMVCPASPEGGKKATCSSCLACSGVAGRHTKDVVICAHGSRGKVTRLEALLRSAVSRI